MLSAVRLISLPAIGANDRGSTCLALLSEKRMGWEPGLGNVMTFSNS